MCSFSCDVGRNNAEADRIDGRMGSDIKGRHEKLTEVQGERSKKKLWA